MFVSLVHQILFDYDTDKLAKTEVDPYIFISRRKRIVECSNCYVFNKILYVKAVIQKQNGEQPNHSFVNHTLRGT